MVIRRLRRRCVPPLLALTFFALFLTSPELLHAHGADSVGLYNAQCPLAEIAARRGQASLPSTSPDMATWWAVGPAPLAVVLQLFTSFARYTDSRAPPLA